MSETNSVAKGLSHFSLSKHGAGERNAEWDLRVYETILSSTSDFVYAIGLDKRFIYVNQALLTMWGLDTSEVLGRTFHELNYENWHAEMHEREIDYVVANKKAFRGKIPFTGTHGRRIYDYIFSPVFDEFGDVAAIAGTTRDITENEETEAALRRSEERASLALEASEFIGIWIWDMHTTLVTADERFCRLYSVDPILGAEGAPFAAFTEHIHPEDLIRITPAIESVSTQGGKFQEEYRLLQPDGSTRWVVASGSCHLSPEGKPTQFAGVAIDITDRKRLQAVADSQKKALELAAHDAPLTETLQILIFSAEEHSPVPVRASISILDADGKHLRHGVAPNLPEEYNLAIDGLEIGPDSGACGRTAFTKTVTIVPDILEDPQWVSVKELAQKHQLRACWSKPILSSDGEILGTFAIYYSEPRTPTQAERDALAFMARTASILIERELLVTQRRAAEMALQESRHELQQINDAIPQQVWTARPDGQLSYANKHARDYIGDRTQQDGTIDWVGVIHPDDLPNSMRMWSDSLANGKPYEVEQRILHLQSNTYRWNLSRALPIHSDAGEVVKWFGTNTDIEEQKRAAESVSEAKARLSLMVESAHDYAIISMNTEGLIESWSTGAERIFGHTTAEVLDKTISLIFTPEDQAAGAPAHELLSATKNGRANDERWHIRKNGDRFYASGTLAAMYDESQQVRGFIKIARDMTAQQQAQVALIEARNAAEAASIAKTEFLANMSHEIRTPMNAVIGLSNILAGSEPLTARQKEFIRTLQMSADSLLGLINDLLDIAKIEARTVDLEQIPFSLKQLVHEIISMMNVRAQEKGLSFTVTYDKMAWDLVVGDPTRFRQIITNLCSNAVKFTEVGHANIDVASVETNDTEVMVRIMVSDTGIGIAPEKLDAVFGKFIQADNSINRKYGGTGLGLAISKTLTEIMGGKIEVQSRLNEGSTFTLSIPMRKATEEEIASSDLSLTSVMENVKPVPLSPRILLVEDYPPNVLVATTFLESFGYTVEVAENGIEAIDKVKTMQFALVLMDVQMHGMNGLEATQLIREYEKRNQMRHLPIIGMTAHALASDRERCLSAGMDEYISKPFNPNTLQTKLSSWIENKN